MTASRVRVGVLGAGVPVGPAEPADTGKAAIRKLAEGLGISPGIVVGRLQFERGLPFSHCNDLRRRFKLVERADSEAA